MIRSLLILLHYHLLMKKKEEEVIEVEIAHKLHYQLEMPITTMILVLKILEQKQKVKEIKVIIAMIMI